MSLLTKKLIESLQSKDKPYVEWDAAIKGFGCKIHPTGRKVYLYKYRNLERKEIWLTLGKHGLLTVDMARKRVSDILAQINNGIDPQAEKKKKKTEKKESMFFKDFWKIFEETYISQRWGDNTLEQAQTLIKRVTSFFGNKKLDEITRETVLSFDRFLKEQKAGPSSFTKTYVAILRPLFNHAEKLGYKERNTNPCYDLPRYKSKKVAKILSEDEIEPFLEKLDQYKAKNPQVKAAIYLKLYCGFRPQELLQLKWLDVELDKRQIYFKKSKTGEKVLPLHQTAIDIFKSIPKKEGNPYVFYGRNPGKPLTSARGLWKSLKKYMRIDLKIYDLRHTFITKTLRETDNLALTSKLAGHKNLQTTMRYVHLAADKDLRAGIDKVGATFRKKI